MKIRGRLYQVDFRYENLQEIRIRAGQKVRLHYAGKEWIPKELEAYTVTVNDLEEMMEYISQYSLYAFEQEIKQGYITIEGGHRVGFVGKGLIERGQIKSMKYISSINVRVAHEVWGCATDLMHYIVEKEMISHTLIISPPRCGKTTILRDLIRLISDGTDSIKGQTVGVVDERSEIGACYQGVPQMHLGSRTDILDACPKAEGMMMLIRSMSPRVIAVDELGMQDDVLAVEYAIHCGCKLITTIHGNSLNEIRKKYSLKRLLDSRVFERYILLSNQPKVGSIMEVYDGNYGGLYQSNRECDDFDDRYFIRAK